MWIASSFSRISALLLSSADTKGANSVVVAFTHEISNAIAFIKAFEYSVSTPSLALISTPQRRGSPKIGEGRCFDFKIRFTPGIPPHSNKKLPLLLTALFFRISQ